MFHRKPDWRIRLEGVLMGLVAGLLLIVLGLVVAYVILFMYR